MNPLAAARFGNLPWGATVTFSVLNLTLNLLAVEIKIEIKIKKKIKRLLWPLNPIASGVELPLYSPGALW